MNIIIIIITVITFALSKPQPYYYNIYFYVQITSTAVAHALPVDYSSSDSICDFLAALGLSTYAGDFAARGLVIVDQLRGLTAADLCDIGVNPDQHVNRLLGAVDAIRTLSSDRMSTSSYSSLSRPTAHQSSGGIGVASRQGQVARPRVTSTAAAATRVDDGRAASAFSVAGQRDATSTKIAKGSSTTSPISKIVDRV